MEILIVLLLILLNGIFSMSEIAMVSSRKSRFESAAKRGDASAKRALELANNPGKFLSTVQIGITLIGILTGIYSGEKIQDDLVQYLQTIPMLAKYAAPLATSIIVISLTFLSLVLGELVPKRIGLTMPEKISISLAVPMYWISIITAPFIWLLTFTSDLIIKIFRIKPSTDSKITEEEIKAIIQEGTEGGAIEEIEQDIVGRVFSLGDRKITSLMTHRNDTILLRTNSTAQEVRATVNSEIHSVYPVLDEKSDIVGIVYLKDLFANITALDFNLLELMKEPQYVADSLDAYEVLKMFKSTKQHQAIVIDEFGEMQGLVTMNDLLESLVGDVSDFHSSDYTYLQRPDGSWLIDGQYPLHELMYKLDLNEFAKEYPFDTISGLILHQLRKVPSAGDRFEWLNYTIEIMDMDGARIDKILLYVQNNQ
jgi:putative hemolysin